MKSKIKISFLFVFVLNFFFLNAQEPKDSTIINRKKQRFIGIDVGGGLGWREYKNVDDRKVIYIPEKGETPGVSYVLDLNYGLTKRRWTQSLGIEYNYAQYRNNKVGPVMGMPYKYTYTHQFLSLFYSFNYYFGKNQNGRAGANFKFGYMTNYTQKIDNVNYSYTINMKKNPVAWVGVFIGRKVFETKTLKMFIDAHCNISSLVGYTTVKVGYDPWSPSGGGAYVIDKYETKPHIMLLPTLQINLQHKL